MITTWYLQSQRTWDRLCHSCIDSSFLPRGAFPEGGAYAVPQRLHAGSLEALRVSRPEAVVLAVNKLTNPLRRDGVVPLPVKLVSRDSHRRQSVVSDLDPSRVVTRIKPRSDLQSVRGRHLTDQVDHHRSAHQGTTT